MFGGGVNSRLGLLYAIETKAKHPVMNYNYFLQLTILGKLHVQKLEMVEGKLDEEPPNKKQKTNEGMYSAIKVTTEWSASQ